MSASIILIGVLLLLVVIAAVIVPLLMNLGNTESNQTDEIETVYTKKPLLSKNEQWFLQRLKEIEKHNLIVVPQINLASIISKTGRTQWQNELFRNVDFGIFDQDYNLLLLIELNDASHLQASRKNRDWKVKKLCERAGVKLMTFYTDKPNRADYIVERILRELAAAPSGAETD